MKRGRGRPPKTPTFSSKILNSGRRGSHHGGPSSPRVSSKEGVKTRDSNRSVQRKHYFEGIQFSESDSDSDSSYESSVSSVVSSVPSYRSPRLRVIPMRSVTPLKLPPSSDDIILPPEHVLQALSIYEVLRQFGRILRLSPFRYEDFCAAIDSAEQSALLSQIHMALFRALLLEDETNGYTFAASDEKDSLNIFLHEVDCFTWPEHIRSYFFSDKSEFGDIFNLVFGRDHNNPFPFVSIEDRLKVLKRLCDLFLASNTVREVIINEGITESEDHCRSCCKMGDLLCCENCPAVYHLHCLKPPLEMVPDGDWLCPICDEHRLKGVTECHTDYTKDGWLRHTPIGTDREGRKYWFLSRRLFVESDDETVRYYSSKPHFDELIEYLEADGQERRLLSALKTKYNTIVKHMAITMSLVEASRGNMTSGLLPRRKHVEAKKSSEAVVETVKEETSPKVSLTFVPDTAVVKMVTKGNQESPNEVETDRRLIAMKQHEEMKEDEEMEEGGNSTLEKDNTDTNNKTLVKQQDICGNDSAKKEDIDVSCRSDINMDSKSPELSKTEKNSSQKSEQVTSEKKGDNIAHGTTIDKSNLLDKQTNIVDSPINASTASGSAAVSLHSVRKIIDFGSSEMESSQPLGAEASKEISSVKDDSEKNHLVQNNDVEQSNDKGYDADVVKLVKQESELDKPVTEPVNQGTQVEVAKDEESKMETKEDVKPVKQETELDKPVIEPVNQETQVEVTKDEESKTETKEGVKQEDPGQEEDNKEIIEEDTKQKENKPIITPEMPEPKGPFFRLGMEGNFTAYVNQYATNPLALNKSQHMEYKERKRSVNNKFSVEHEFKISGEIFGPKDVILNTLRCSIVNLENNIPAAFMHPIWPLQRSTWVRAVHIATTPEEFGAVLMFLESLIRPLCFIPVWSDALGHVELHRAIVETKAERAARKREHREEDEEVEVQPRALVNYSWVPMHQIWKQKGEEYRIFKGGGWTWHSGMSTRKRKHCFTKDRREFECKKRKLSKVVDDFINKREEKKKEAERKAKAKLAVQAYKENMKTIQSVTQGKMVTQAITPPKPSVVTNAGVQMNAVSQSTVTTCVNTVVLQGLPVVTVSGGIKSLLPSGNTVTQSSSVTQVTQSIGVVPITQSQGPQVTTGAVQVTQSTVVPQVTPLSSVVQVTQSTGMPKVADSAGVTQVPQSTGVPQVTPLSGIVQVTQSTSMPKVTHSAGVTQVMQSTGVPQVTPLSGIVQVTQSTGIPKVADSAGVTQVTQSTVVPQVTPLSSVVQVMQSTVVPQVTPLSSVVQVTQSTVVPQVTPLSGIVQVTQSTGIPKVADSAGVTQVTQSTVVPQVTPLSGIVQVTQSTGIPKVADSAGVTQVTQSTGVPQVTPLSSVVQVTQPTSIPKVTHSAGVTQVTQSTVVPQVTPLSGIVQVTQSTSMPKVTHSAGVTQVTQSTGMPKLADSVGVTQVTQSTVVPKVTPLPGTVQVTQSTSVPKVTNSAGVTQVTQSTGVPQATQLSRVMNVTQSTSTPKVTLSTGMVLDQQPTPTIVSETVDTTTKIHAITKEGVASHTDVKAAIIAEPVLLPSGLTTSAAQSLPIAAGLQPVVPLVVQPNSVTGNVMPNDVMPKIHNVTQPPPNVTQSPPNVTQSTLVASDCIATQPMNSTVTDSVSSNTKPNLLGISVVHQDSVQAKTPKEQCSETKTSQTLSQTTTGEERQHLNSTTSSEQVATDFTLENESKQGEKVCASDSNKVTTQPGTTQGIVLDVVDNLSSDMRTVASNPTSILTDNMDTNVVPCSKELLTDKTKNNIVSSTSEEVISTKSCVSGDKGTSRGTDQDGMCSVTSNCTYDFTEDDDWIIIQSNSKTTNKQFNQMDNSKTSSENSKRYDCLPSSNAVEVDMTDSQINIRKEPNMGTTVNVIENSIDIHEKNQTPATLENKIEQNIPLETTVECCPGSEISNHKEMKQDTISCTSHITKATSDLNTSCASENVASSTVPVDSQALSGSQTLLKSNCAASSSCISSNTSNPDSSKENTSSTPQSTAPSLACTESMDVDTRVTSVTEAAAPTTLCEGTSVDTQATSLAVETTASTIALTESMTVDTQVTSVTVAAPSVTLCESSSVDTQATSFAVATPASTLGDSMAVNTQVTSVTVAAPSTTLCESSSVDTQATSLAVETTASTTALTESMTVDTQVTSVTVAAPSVTLCESSSVDTQATSFAVATPASTLAESMTVDTQVTSVTVAAPSAILCQSSSVTQATSVTVTAKSSTLSTQNTAVTIQPTPLAVAAPLSTLSKDIPTIAQDTSVTAVKPSSSSISAVTTQPKPFAVAAESLLASSQNTAVTSKSALLTIGAPVSATFSQNSTSTTQVTPLSITVPSATLSQITSSVNQGTLPSIASVSSSQIRKLLTQATLPVTATSTASSQNVTLLTQASLQASHNSNVGIQTAVLSAPSSATSVAVVPSKSLTTATAAAFPTISGLPLSASSLISLGVPITSSGVVKVSQAVIQDPKSNVNVTSSSQESLGMVLTKTLINTAMKASQNVGSTAKQVTLTATPKMAQSAQPKVVKTVNTTRPQPIAAKPTQQLRAIAPQPRPQVVQPGQTTVLQNSPQTTQINFPLLSGNTLQGGVVKINTSGVSTPGTPVNNIAALVASLPGNTGTPGQPQLIRFVTPSGASFTVQGTIQPGPQGSAPGSTTINVPKRLLTSSVPAVTKPLVVAPKTVAATTNRTTVTVPRPQQPVVPKVNKAVLPPQKKENYPVLEPLVKDPRKLINRVMSKWRNNRCSVKSVFQLKKHERRILGRRAGMREVPGYAYVTRGSGINWPPSFPRPSFKVAWRYRSSSLRTLAGAGLQARILHACLKWEDINIRPPRSNSSTVCTGTGTTSSEVINHRYVTRDGLKCEYLVRKIVRTMRKPAPETPRPPPPTVSKRGRTLRPKINLQPDDEDEDEIIHTGPRVFESWCPESELELWEVRQYNERKERERALEREKKIQEEANRRAAELRAAAIQRRQQEQQAKQQQQILKKKVQNAIKTQQKKLTNVNQATPRVTYKPITMATMSASGITSTQVIRPATVPRQPVPRITNLVTQYRPPSLKQARVPIGTPATGMIRTVTRAQVNYRPLATTTQAKMSTPGVTPTVKAVSNIPYVARGLGMNAPKMKHSSKELQQAKQQIAKAKGKKSGGAGLGPSAGKKHVPLETRQEMNRIAVCRKLIDQLIGKIERSEEQERNKESKRKAVAQKQQRAKANKLDGILYKRKEMLKKEIIRKRAVLEKELTLELSKESKKKTPTKKRKRESSLGSVGDMLHDKKQKTVEELYCVCRKPYDPTMFYIGCDLCANWFHGECVGVTPERAAIMEQFTCTECSKAQQGVETEELYCLCRQPYDESKFYIGCDTCHDWFHGSCVGMTEVEADMLDSYLCPRCKESQSSRDVQPLSSKDYDSLKRLLRSLQSHKMAWPFLEPVSADDVPGYYDIIKEPMDLSKVEDRLSTKHYNTVEQFNADITTMFDNCRFFNPKESPYYRCAEVLEGFFVKKLRAWQKKA